VGVIRATFLVDEEGEVTGTWYNVRADAGRLPEGTGVDLRATDTGESWVVPPGTADPTVVSGSRRRLLAWSVGREVRTGTPPLRPWGR